MTSCGSRTLCDGQEAPTQWKSVSVPDYKLTGVTGRDGYASKNDNNDIFLPAGLATNSRLD